MVHLLKTSLIDYPGKIASVLFTGHCNLSCGYCHNAPLLDGSIHDFMTWQDAIALLELRKHRVDAVVISGGEPTLEPALMMRLENIKHAGFSIKLDTNGTQAKTLKAVLEAGLVDYVALDLKGSHDHYLNHFGASPDHLHNIAQTLDLLKHSGVPYELRTTLLKDLHTPLVFSEWFKTKDPINRWVLQQFQYAPHNLKPIPYATFSHDEMKAFQEVLQDVLPVKEVKIRSQY